MMIWDQQVTLCWMPSAGAAATTMTMTTPSDHDDCKSATATMDEYVCMHLFIYLYIYLLFASIASIASVAATVQLVFVCFNPQQSFIKINSTNTSSIEIIDILMMTSFSPITTVKHDWVQSWIYGNDQPYQVTNIEWINLALWAFLAGLWKDLTFLMQTD